MVQWTPTDDRSGANRASVARIRLAFECRMPQGTHCSYTLFAVWLRLRARHSSPDGDPLRFGTDRNSVVALRRIDFAANAAPAAAQAVKSTTPPPTAVAFTRLPEPRRSGTGSRSDSSTPPRGSPPASIYYRPLAHAVVGACLPHEHQFGQLRARGRLHAGPAWSLRVHGARWRCGRQHDGHDPALERTAMLLTFPLKSGVQLKGYLSGGSHRLTVGYGRPSKVSG